MILKYLRNTIIAFVLMFLCFNVFMSTAMAGETPVIDFYFSPTCPHCASEKIYLNELEERYDDIVINRYSVTEQGNVDRLMGLYEKYSVPEENRGIVPITFIGAQVFLGFDENRSPPLMDDSIANIADGRGGIIGDDKFSNRVEILNQVQPLSAINIPFFGEIDVTQFSPIALSITVGVLDGFNACAMVALGFLLTVLVSTGQRKKVVLIGGVFILVSGLVYFIFIAAWLNLFLFLSLIKPITIIIAVIIITFSVFLLKDYYSDVICKICDVPEGKKDGIFTRAQKFLFTKLIGLTTADMPLPMMLLGVALVAAGVNLVELFCSFGFPLAYTKILTTYELSSWAYYGNLLLYILFYMIDDFLIFMIAVFTLRVTKVSDKYLKVIKLISGVILLILGILMLFRPEILVLG